MKVLLAILPLTRSRAGPVTKVLPRRNGNTTTPLMSLTPQEVASGQASDISSLTSLGNSSARKEEVMDLSPMLGKKYGPIWTELQRGKPVGEAFPVSLKLQKALVSQLYFPHPEPMRRVPVTHHHAPSCRAICCFLHVPSTPTFTDRQHCVCCL